MGNCSTCFKPQENSEPTRQIERNDNNSQNLLQNNQPISQSPVAGNTVIASLNSNEQENSISKSTDKLKSGKKGNSLFSNGMSSNLQEPLLASKDTQISDNALNKLFEEYKDSNDDAILSEGIERLCHDLEYKPDDFAILVLAWCLDAQQMCCFTKTEFIQGLQRLNASTIEEIKFQLQQKIKKLSIDQEMFKQLYRFTFRFGLEPSHRTLSLDMAIILWKLVFTVNTPLILDRWINFLEKNQSTIRGLTRDTWNMFLNFAETCDISQYDADEAWPSLFDDFVEYENDRLNQNLSKNPNNEVTNQNNDYQS